MVSDEMKAKIRTSFQKGKLFVHAADTVTGDVSYHPVSDIMRHEVPHKKAFEVVWESGESLVMTEDHSLFYEDVEGGLVPVRTSDLRPGDTTASVCASPMVVQSVTQVEMPKFMYDLCVPGPENFVLDNGVIAHNSYSIGGISLDIQNSSKYESLKQNAEGQFDKAAEAKARTCIYFKGLRQSRYGVGMKSSFGPQLGTGILSPGSFVGAW